MAPTIPELRLDAGLVAACRQLAATIAKPVLALAERHSTVSIERAVLRLWGVDGVDAYQVPLPNVVVEHLREQGLLAGGASLPVAKACLARGLTPQQVAEQVAAGGLTLAAAGPADGAAREHAQQLSATALAELDRKRQARAGLKAQQTLPPKPWKYLIVASGNIFEDVRQAVAAARQGADIIAVIRSTGQSLLDFVPHGHTTEGTGGTFATRANFQLMRGELDKVGAELGRYIQLTNYASGLCMPEITALAAIEGLDMLLNDAMYGILFRDINMQRTLFDQLFSRRLNARADIIINTGEDNYLTTADAYEEGHTVLASQFINEQFALAAGMRPGLMGLGHAMEIDPFRENAFLAEISMALLVRQVFPEAPLKYMPPTKHMTGNVFLGYAHNTLFNLITVLTGQEIQLLGILTEALHTPLLSDRYLALQNADYLYNTARDLGANLSFTPDGFIQTRAEEVLQEAHDLLVRVEAEGMMLAIEHKAFAQVSRTPTGGKGLDGVFEKGPGYANPLGDLLAAGTTVAA